MAIRASSTLVTFCATQLSGQVDVFPPRQSTAQLAELHIRLDNNMKAIARQGRQHQKRNKQKKMKKGVGKAA